MESTAKYLMKNTSDIFDIYVYDITQRTHKEDLRSFKSDPGSLTIYGNINCLPGQVPNDELCSKILFYKFYRFYIVKVTSATFC
jgi:hypothetical protein